MHADPNKVDLGSELLGAALQQRRERAGLSRRQVSELSGVGYDTVFSVERGRRLPSLITMLKLAEALKTHPRDLLTGVYPWDDVPPPR
ncbi:MAG: hypothetical protein NVSMB48_09210 [Marmoricola sp.]